MNAELPTKKFRLGRLVATPNALSQLTPEDILRAIQRHQAGDWGDVSQEDRRANDIALQNSTRILSVYHTERRVRFWIITEADRSATTMLLPQDY